MAPSPDSLAVEATSRPRKGGHETPQLRLERRLHDGSPYRSSDLVNAGPAPQARRLSDYLRARRGEVVDQRPASQPLLGSLRRAVQMLRAVQVIVESP